jgi:hypothetical protein
VSALGTWSCNAAIVVYAYQPTHPTTWMALDPASVGGLIGVLLLRGAARVTSLQRSVPSATEVVAEGDECDARYVLVSGSSYPAM